jgi:hypothetical protein
VESDASDDEVERRELEDDWQEAEISARRASVGGRLLDGCVDIDEERRVSGVAGWMRVWNQIGCETVCAAAR